jgi:glycosyltransferase involved in cell wall biosynthesis
MAFVVHDLLPLVVEDYIVNWKCYKRAIFRALIRRNLRKKNTRCIAVSESTKNDLLDNFGYKYDKKIDVVYEGCWNNNRRKKTRPSYADDYLFYVGDRRRHKNLRRMADIFEIMVNDLGYSGKFIIAGSKKNYGYDFDEYLDRISGVECIGRVNDEELDGLYGNMSALFFLSRYEGFGLPILEAASYNKKIITSNRGSCAEISPPSALIVDNERENRDIAVEIMKYLKEPKEIDNSAYLEMYDWNDAARKIFREELGN